MLNIDVAMVESLTFAHWQKVECLPYTWDGYGYPVYEDPLLVRDGTIEQDTEPPVRRYGRLSVAVPALSTPAEVRALGEDLVAGAKMLLLVWTMRLMDGREFSVEVASLRTEAAEWNATTGLIDITAADLGQSVADDRFVSPRTLAPGDPFIDDKRDAISELLHETQFGSWVTFLAGVGDEPLYPVTFDRDRDAAVTELCTALGAWWSWAPQATVPSTWGWTIAPVPTPTTDPLLADWIVPEGSGIVDSTGSSSREGVCNAVSVTGQTPEGETTATPYAVVYDDDPTSPTYWDGPFGHKPTFYASPVLGTDAECEAAATTILARSRGLTRGMVMDTPVHPGLEVGDTISFASGEPAGVFVVDQISLPLTGGPMRLTVRQVA